MARPRSIIPTCSPFLRGNSLSARLSFGDIKYLTPVLAKVEPTHLAKNGYLNTNAPDYVGINEKLAGAVERLEKAFLLAQSAQEVTSTRIGKEYQRLTKETENAAKHAQQRHQVEHQASEFNRRIGNERRLLKQVRDEDLDDHIQRLTDQLTDLRLRRDRRDQVAGTYEQDKLLTYLDRYATRDGLATMAESTRRSHDSFIATVRRFSATTRIQDVDEQWMLDFQDWLITTPSLKPIYSTMPNPDYVPGNGQKQKIKGKILRWHEGEPLVNSSVKTYMQKITSCLNYYQQRAKKLPAGVVIGDDYKLYTFKLLSKEDNVMALEEEELFQLVTFNEFKMREQERARDIFVFLCATSLRHSDLVKVVPGAVKNGHIKLVARKTRKHIIEVNIPLNQISRSILEKYGYDMRACKLSKHKINQRIREVLNHNEGKTFPSLQEPVTIINYSGNKEVSYGSTRANEIGTHSGRRTFINICLDYNVPINKIIGQTGHTDVNTLMIYANKRKDVNKHMSNIFNLPAYEAQDYAVPELVEVVE